MTALFTERSATPRHMARLAGQTPAQIAQKEY
jgi:hypothetical protein